MRDSHAAYRARRRSRSPGVGRMTSASPSSWGWWNRVRPPSVTHAGQYVVGDRAEQRVDAAALPAAAVGVEVPADVELQVRVVGVLQLGPHRAFGAQGTAVLRPPQLGRVGPVGGHDVGLTAREELVEDRVVAVQDDRLLLLAPGDASAPAVRGSASTGRRTRSSAHGRAGARQVSCPPSRATRPDTVRRCRPRRPRRSGSWRRCRRCRSSRSGSWRRTGTAGGSPRRSRTRRPGRSRW